MAASVGLMHNTLVRLGLTQKKSADGRMTWSGRTSPNNASNGGPGKAL